MARLDELKGLLASREHVTALELSEELGVALRTIRRDLELLREMGLPIEANRGRGGGLRLYGRWSLGRLQLTPSEAIDVLLSLAIAERMGSPLLLEHLPGIRRKLGNTFTPADRSLIGSLRKRVLVGTPASPAVTSTYTTPQRRAFGGLVEAFFDLRCVAMEYVDQKGERTARDVEPHFLYLSMPVWYILGWDRLREGVRYFRIDRIRSARPLGSVFRLGDPKVFLAEAERGIAGL
jgi:predicted DNA-binding transcriptional regulator YafY